MNCPKCKVQTKVTDSRWKESGWAVRRRVECPECLERFTTYEKIEELSIEKGNAIGKSMREMADNLSSLARLLEDNYGQVGRIPQPSAGNGD